MGNNFSLEGFLLQKEEFMFCHLPGVFNSRVVSLLIPVAVPMAPIGFLLFWTFPFSKMGMKWAKTLHTMRSTILQLIPFLPTVMMDSYADLPDLIRHLPVLAKHIDSLAPALPHVMKHHRFLIRNLDAILEQEENIPYIAVMGPAIGRLSPEEVLLLESHLPQLLDKLDVMGPKAHLLAPYLSDMLPVLHLLLPHVEYFIPHLEDMHTHIPWILLFLKVEGWEVMLEYLEELCMHLDELKAYAPRLVPHLPYVFPYFKTFAKNLDTFMPMMDDEMVECIGPMMKLGGFALPLAHKSGMLRTKVVKKSIPPLAKTMFLKKAKRANAKSKNAL